MSQRIVFSKCLQQVFFSIFLKFYWTTFYPISQPVAMWYELHLPDSIGTSAYIHTFFRRTPFFNLSLIQLGKRYAYVEEVSKYLNLSWIPQCFLYITEADPRTIFLYVEYKIGSIKFMNEWFLKNVELITFNFKL